MIFETPTIDYVKVLAGKRVILNSMLDASIDKDGNISDESRLKGTLETIKLIEKNVRNLIIVGHLGRPSGPEEKYSLKPVCEWLQNRLNSPISFVEDLSEENLKKINIRQDGVKIYLVENMRFHEGEQSDDEKVRAALLESLTKIGEVYVNDAFSSYRKTTSTFYLPQALPSYIGPNFQYEINNLKRLKDTPERPFILVLGGAKLSTKINIIEPLIKQADKTLIGGAMAYTFMKANSIDIGSSLIEEEYIPVAKDLLRKYGDKIKLPIDHKVSKEFKEGADIFDEPNKRISNNYLGIDIGIKTASFYSDIISSAKTVLWNGPMGVFEWEKSEVGTVAVGRAIGRNKLAFSVAGGGDTEAAISKFKLTGFNHISLGGGAMLSYLAEDKFPTLDVIGNK